MRSLTYYVAVTLDGYIADPAGGFEFFPVEGPHMAWLSERYPETLPGHVRTPFGIDASNQHFDTVVMGRATYEPALDIGVTDPYPHLRTVVFSRSLESAPNGTVEITAEDPVSKVQRLKEDDGLDIWLCGGGKLAGVLQQEIDELLIKRYPIIAGNGRRLFEGAFHPEAFAPVHHHAFDNDVVFTHYRRS